MIQIAKAAVRSPLLFLNKTKKLRKKRYVKYVIFKNIINFAF